MTFLSFGSRLLVSGLALTLVMPACERKQKPPSNLILISVDTLRPDRLGVYGGNAALSSSVDSIASHGTTFNRAYAPMPRTTPAVASMMTGLWPHRHGSREVHQPVTNGTMIVTPLKRAGFATVGITANPTVGKRQGFAGDFDVFEESLRFEAPEVTSRSLAALRRIPSEQRLFLWAHYYDPHWPYRPPKRWQVADTEACSALSELTRGARQSNTGGDAHRALEACWRAYDSEIKQVDREIGRLLKALDESGRLQDALVVFTSDHGENFGEDGLYYSHGRSVHEAGVRVPLIIAGPGLRENRHDDSVVRLVDLAPTILSLMGMPTDALGESIDGVDVSYAVRGGRDPRHEFDRFAFAESGGALIRDDYSALLSGRTRTGYCLNDGPYSLCWKRNSEPSLHNREKDPEMRIDLRLQEPDRYETLLRAKARWRPGKTRSRMVTDGRFKLVERPRLEGGYERSLYDLSVDHEETEDVSGRFARTKERLSSALDAWAGSVPGYVPEALTQEVEDRLRALGYVE